MRHCAGLVRSRFVNGWNRCARKAQAGDILCSTHRDAFDSALLGIMEFEQKQQGPVQPELQVDWSFPHAGHAKRRGGKNDAPAARPGPGTRVSRSHSIEDSSLGAAARGDAGETRGFGAGDCDVSGRRSEIVVEGEHERDAKTSGRPEPEEVCGHVCIDLIRTIPTLVRDSARIEDVEKMDGDDAADAARYGLKSRYAAQRRGLVRPPLEQRLAERVTSEDATFRRDSGAQGADRGEGTRTAGVIFAETAAVTWSDVSSGFGEVYG
jgi:hypothetical protein